MRSVPPRRLRRRAGRAAESRARRRQDHGARGHGRRRFVRVAPGRHHRPEHHHERADGARRNLGHEPAVPALLSRPDRRRAARRRSRGAAVRVRPRGHALARQQPDVGSGWMALRGARQHEHGARQRRLVSRAGGLALPPRDGQFELFAQGGGNPWTLSFDSKGRAFSGDNGGNSRGFHWVAGGRYEKNWPKHGPFTRPFSFGFIPNMDHEGYAARFAMTGVIYEDGKLPGVRGTADFRDGAHQPHAGHAPGRDGSTFRTVDTDALVTTADRSFRPVDMAVGPDGAIYIADWCDIRMDHTDPRDTWDKSCGRIWRLRAKDSRPALLESTWPHGARELVQLLGDRESGTANTRGGCSANVGIGVARSGVAAARARRARRSRTRGPVDGEPDRADGSGLGAPSCWRIRTPPFAPGPAAVQARRVDRRRRCATRLVRLARTEPDAEVRSELANTPARLARAGACGAARN